MTHVNICIFPVDRKGKKNSSIGLLEKSTYEAGRKTPDGEWEEKHEGGTMIAEGIGWFLSF